MSTLQIESGDPGVMSLLLSRFIGMRIDSAADGDRVICVWTWGSV
jgi:hypothetical protein